MHGPPKDRNGRANGHARTVAGRNSPSLGSKTNLLGHLDDDHSDHPPPRHAHFSPEDDGTFSGSYEPVDGDDGVPLSRDEVMVIEGVLNLKEKTVAAAMVSFDKVFMLSMDSVLDFKTFDKVIDFVLSA
jgi:hypothetical protein